MSKRLEIVCLHLATSMSAVATITISGAHSVRIEIASGADISNAPELDAIIPTILRGLKDCNESKARMGYFAD